MSLANLLAQHSRDLTAGIQHQNAVEQDNVDRKANDLEEKFQHVKDSIEGAGGEITALAGAYHMGRKIYQKVQAKRAQLKAKAENPTQPDEDGRAKDASQNSGAPEPEPGTQESGATASADAEDARTAQANEEAQPDTQPTADEPSEATQSSAGAGEDTITDQTENIGGGSRYQLGEEDRIPGTASNQPSGDLSRNLASDDSPETTIAKTGGVDDSNSGIAKVGELADSDAPGQGLIQRGLTKAGNVGDDIMGGIKNVGRKIAGKFASIGGDAVEGGLETASTVLDALGPIGEVAGVITGLVGLFEGLGHKKKDVAQTGQEATSSATVSAGVDTSALTEQTAQSVGTQV